MAFTEVFVLSRCILGVLADISIVVALLAPLVVLGLVAVVVLSQRGTAERGG